MDGSWPSWPPSSATGKIFRPYRDVRFSKDKSPYKTAIGATLERAATSQFSADGPGRRVRLYMMMPDQLDRYRRAVADEKRARRWWSSWPRSARPGSRSPRTRR